MPEWASGFTNEQLTTPEAQEWLGKYTSPEEALAGGFNAAKTVGKPFRLPESLDKLSDDKVRGEFTSAIDRLMGPYRLPESLDKLPDDKSRGEFSSRIGKLMGAVEKEEDLADVNFADGLADARTVNAELVGAFKKFAIAEKLPKALVGKLAKFNNEFATQLVAAQEAARTESAKKVNEALVPLYGGDEGIKKHNEMVRRLFKNHAGLSAQEYEEAAPGLVDSGITQNLALCKALYNIAKQTVPENVTESVTAPGGPTGNSMAERQNRELPTITGFLWPKKAS